MKATASSNGSLVEPADVLIVNAQVYTVDDAMPRAEAVAIRGDRIIWVGSEVEETGLRGGATSVINAGGRLLLPGFIECHSHIRFGNILNRVNLGSPQEIEAATDINELRSRVGAFARVHPDLEWIIGDGWYYLPDRPDGLPTAQDLEGLTDGRPAFFAAIDGHTVWLNRAAMELVGLTRESPLALREEVVKDSESGEPTGVIHGSAALGEDNEVMTRLRDLMPDEAEGFYASLKESLKQAVHCGYTTVIDPQVDLKGLGMFERARAEGILKPRLEIALWHPPSTTEAQLLEFDAARQRFFDDDYMRVSAVKLYIDDVIDARTAAMLEPYSDLPDEAGDTYYTPEEFKQVVARLDRRGYQLFTHAIGDRGIRIVLDALEHARRVNGVRDSRHQLVHAEIVPPQDQPRFKEMGVVACMQPRHVFPEGMLGYAAAIGPERARYAFPWRSLHEAGTVLAFSSDWPTSPMDPLIGIYSAISRKSMPGSPIPAFVPEQAVDLETAIRAYTLNGAYANFAESNRGSVTAGKYADLILLSQDLFAIPPEEIVETHVVLTMIGGEIVYRDF